MRRRWLPILPALLVLLAGGCHRAYRPAPNPVEIDPAEYDRVFEASVDVLRDHGFRVDRRDHRFGRITTQPLGSPTVFEPWIDHNTTAHQTAQSTFDHLRRTVTVSLEPLTAADLSAMDELGESLEAGERLVTGEAEGGADAGAGTPPAYLLRVEVLMENQQVPIRRLNGSVTGSRFSALRAVPTEWSERNIGPSYWQPIGRDAFLEDRLARQIIERSLQLPEPGSPGQG